MEFTLVSDLILNVIVDGSSSMLLYSAGSVCHATTRMGVGCWATGRCSPCTDRAQTSDTLVLRFANEIALVEESDVTPI